MKHKGLLVSFVLLGVFMLFVLATYGNRHETKKPVPVPVPISPMPNSALLNQQISQLHFRVMRLEDRVRTLEKRPYSPFIPFPRPVPWINEALEIEDKEKNNENN